VSVPGAASKCFNEARIRMGSSPLNLSAAILASSGRFVGVLSGGVDWPSTAQPIAYSTILINDFLCNGKRLLTCRGLLT
jgi:hypothetical protein